MFLWDTACLFWHASDRAQVAILTFRLIQGRELMQHTAIPAVNVKVTLSCMPNASALSQ